VPRPTWSNLPAAKRARVLDAAMAEFGRHGFSGGSLNVIAREAGVAKGSLFQYFEDKLDLFTFVCATCSERIRREMERIMVERFSGQPLFDFLRVVALDWMAYFREHPVDRGVTLATNFELDPEVRAAVRGVVNQHYLEVLGGLIALAADQGQLRDDVDHAGLLAYLVLLLPHLALAPTAEGLDPVLGLHGATPEAQVAPVHALIDALERAYAPTPTPAHAHPHAHAHALTGPRSPG
jgi:AcrR family transcriptional regulator